MSSVSRAPGTLIVEVPHWAATVRVFDNLSQTAIDVSSPVEVPSGVFCVTSTLNPGVYKVEVALGSTADSEWVSVRPEKQTTVPASRWETLHLASAAPLQARGSGGPRPHAQAAEAWSHSTTWPATQAGAARLFIFVQTPDPKQHPNFSQGLTLLDANGQPLTALESGTTLKDADVGCMAFATDLPGGFYILSRSGPGPVRYNQPLYLCEDWETHVFIVGGKGPSFRYLTINMAPRGAGFRHDDETTTASEAVLTALVRERGLRAVLGSSELSRMLRQEHKNPWLAVLAAHAIMAAEEEAERDGIDHANLPNYDPALKDEVLQFLTTTIGQHPDVRALMLRPGVPASQPFDFPPMLRIGLRRVQRHATQFAATVPVGSVTDKMLARQVTSSAWSVWRQPDDSAAGLETVTNEPAGVKARGRRRITSAILRSGFTPDAPIYLASPAAGAAPPGESGLGRVLYDLPVIKAAQNMIGANLGPLPNKIVVDAKMELTKLLEQIDPRALSAATGIPLGRAERAISRLRSSVQAGTSIADKVGATARAVVEFALRQSSRNQPPAASALEAATNVVSPKPEAARRTTIEEGAETLRSAAIQLTSGEPAPDSNTTDAARAAKIAERLHALAEALLGHADFVAITGRDGQFLYANGAFTMLLSSSDPRHPDREGRRWCKWLSTLPLGRTSHLTAPHDSSGRVWTVHRSAVEYPGSDTPSGYVNILDDERRSTLPPDEVERVTAKMSDVTLHASFVQYGSPRRRTASLEKLEQIATEIEQQLLTQPRVAND
jgi:hypothetical protein